MTSGDTGRFASCSITCRVIGAATFEPNPACSTTVTTTYCFEPTLIIPANSDESLLPSTWAVPVLPAIWNCEGNPKKALYAVPFGSRTAPVKPAIIALYVPG